MNSDNKSPQTRIKFFTIVRKLKYINKNNVFSFLLVLQLLLSCFCYWSYSKNPTLYVLADEIEKRHFEIARTDAENDIREIESLHNEVDSRLKVFNYIKHNQNSFLQSNDGNLMVNDSLYIVKERVLPFPGDKEEKMTIKVYSRHNLTFLLFLFTKFESLGAAIPREIERLELESKEIKHNIQKTKISLNEKRWSFLYFLSYYFRNQLQPMTLTLMAIFYVQIGISALLIGYVVARVWK